jgi:hypothetical protein
VEGGGRTPHQHTVHFHVQPGEAVSLQLGEQVQTIQVVLCGTRDLQYYGTRDPDSIRSVDPDQEGQKCSTKIEKKKLKKFHVLKCWMFSFEG